MIHILRSAASAAIGAAAMFWLDPTRGRSRRAMLEQKVGSVAGDLTEAVGVAGRDLGHRAQGMGHEVRSWFKREPVDDGLLARRVRSALGRVVSHPKAIDVTADNGRVTLSGAVLVQEYEDLLETVCSVRGVHELDERLAVYEDSSGIPGLQGGRPRARLHGLPPRWSPAGRLLLGTGALSLGVAIAGILVSRSVVSRGR